MPLNATNSGSIIISFLMFPEKMDVNKIDKLYQSLAAKFQQIDGVEIGNSSIPFPRMNSTIFTMLLKGQSNSAGGT